MIETMQKKLSGFGANWHCLNSKHNNRRAPTTHTHTKKKKKTQTKQVNKNRKSKTAPSLVSSHR